MVSDQTLRKHVDLNIHNTTLFNIDLRITIPNRIHSAEVQGANFPPNSPGLG